MNGSTTLDQGNQLLHNIGGVRLRRGFAFGIIMFAALVAFELFNYSTTDYALGDLLGKLTFAGIRWSTILALAFCGIDFAGVARLFTPEQGPHEINEVWYLFGAWLLAATMNAILTWWGVSMALLNHQIQSTAVVDASLMIKVVPIFVAVMVWLIRILLIGSLSYAGDQLFAPVERVRTTTLGSRPHQMAVKPSNPLPSAPVPASTPRPAAAHTVASMARPPMRTASRQEPTYHSMSASAGPTPETRR